jgi:hypothetical protein
MGYPFVQRRAGSAGADGISVPDGHGVLTGVHDRGADATTGLPSARGADYAVRVSPPRRRDSFGGSGATGSSTPFLRMKYR